MFTKNMGSVDRGIRAIVGVTLLVAYFLGAVSGLVGVLALVVAIALLATSAMGWCPPYSLLGIKTCSAKSA